MKHTTNAYERYKDFDIVLSPGARSYSSWKEIWGYRSLIYQLVRRDFVANYKQTVLGPAWAVIQPVASTLITAFIFGGLAGLSPSGIPIFLFYMSGQIVWGYFSGCVGRVAGTFLGNMHIMGKIYFPRFVVPIATVLSNSISLMIQVCLFIIFYIGYVISGAPLLPHVTLLLVPLYLLHAAVLGAGSGAILSALTTKYRDTMFLIDYGLNLWMYLTPVVYDVGIVPERFERLYMLNPMTPLINHIRYALFRQGTLQWDSYFISLAISICIFVLGYMVFHRIEHNFIDTI